MSDRIKTLYGQLVRNGYDLGGYEKFNAAMHDSNRRRSLYNQLVANRADLGGYEKFSSVVETALRTTPSAPQKKSDFVADTINMLRTPSSQYTRPQPSKAAGTFEMPSKYDVYHNMPDAIKRHQTPTPLKPEAVMPSVPSSAAESVWAAADKAAGAEVRKKVDEGWSWRKIMQALSSGASVTGGLGDDNAQALETTSVAHLKTHDLQKLSDQAWAALGSKQQQSIINDSYIYLKEQYPDADDKALVDAARKMARAKSDEQMYNLAVEKNMPKSVGEFFLRKAAAASSFGSLSKGYASMMAGTRGDMEAEDTALQKYGAKHKVADIAGSVAGFAVDPLTYASGAVGGATTKVALWAGGKVLSEAAARKMSQTLGGKLLLGAVGGAANFGTFEAGGEAINQYKWGGTLDVDPETGRYVVGDFSLGKVASQMRHGLSMGGLTGAFGTWLGNVSTKAAQATTSTLGKLGVRAGELGVGLVGEGTIFATPEFISTYGDYNDVIKSVSDKNSPNYIADDKERSKYIAELKAQRGERMMDIWQDNLAMIAGFKAQHAIKSAGRTISELAASRRGKVGFVERMGRMLDGHPSLALSKEEQTELDKHGYGDLTQMVKEYKAYAQKDGDLPYNKITQLLNDKNVSEAARAKMYYYVTGHSLPMSAVIASNVIDNGDKTYTVQSLGDNGVITSRTYGSLKRADYEKARIDRQAELNGVAMAEQMFDNMDKAERLKAVCTRLAQDKGVSPETLLWLTRKDPKQMTAAEKRWLKEIEDAANEDAPQGENATVRHIKGVILDEYGVDVDKALRKAADSRTDAEKTAISAYNNELAQAVAERKNAISQDETTDAYRRGYEADTQGMRDAYVAQMYEPSEDNAETLRGVESQITESAKYQAALERDELTQMTHKDGSIHLATLKDKDKDGNGKQVYIVDGDIVMKEDGSGIDADASSKSVIIYDPATGEKKMVSPTAVDGIESLGEVKTAEQTEAEINARMQDTIQRGKDWLVGNVANPVGMQIQLGDGRIATIEAMHEDGKSAIATLPDGTQFLVSKDVLQRIVNNGQYADYKARRDAEASKREAEQGTESAPETVTEGGQPLPEEASTKEEESREYAQGDVFDVVVDGQKMHAEIVSPKDADGRFVVNVDDGESMRTLYVTPEELAAMEYREEPSAKAEETRLTTEDSSEKALERGAQPTEEHAPTALERIPRDEKGNAQFHDVDTETAWDGLVEMSGNEETAHKVAEASLANAEKKLKAAKALKEKGDTPEALLQSIKENEKAVAEAEREVAAWKAIVGEKARREEAAKAEAERIATEKAEAERKAAEERERAEKEEKARIEAEKKEAERIAAEKAEEEARVEDEKKAEEERVAKQKAEKTAEAESDKEEAEKRMDDEEPKPVGSGVFGNIYNQFKGKVKEAFDFLMKHKGGDLLGVFHRKDVGDIDLVWGDHGGGLAHIIRRHIIEQNDFKNVDEIQKVIEDVIRNGLIVRENKDKINIEYNGYRVSIKKTIRDSKGNVVENKNWIVTAFDKSKPKHEKRNPSSSETLTTPSANQKADGVTLPSNEDSTDKGSEKPEKKQEKQSVFDKAKEIADKMERAGLPKEQIDAWKAHIEAADKKMSFEDFQNAEKNAKRKGVRLTEAESPKRKADERYQRGEGGVKPSKAEVALRDAVIDRLRESGMDVIADEAEGQRVLDEVNGRAKVQMGDAPETFAERQKQAVESHGVVMPGLNESYVEVVKDIPRHEYTGSIAEATREAIDAAKRKYAGKELTYNNYGANFNYTISANAIDICLSPKHQNLSANKGIHLALAEHLDEVINKSVEVEEHPDYIKGKDGKRGEEVNPNAIMHRFYGVAVIDGTPCRVMTLMREDGRSEEANGVHSYEVQKIEVLDNESPSTSNGVGTQMKDLSAYPLAKLLKGVEKSYDKGKYLLDESKKRSVGLREQRVDGADGVRFFRTANGEAYGFTVGGRIYIDPRIATSETPVHEYAHLWAEALRNGNPKEWQNVVELMKGTKVWDEVKARYPELKSDDEIADEVIATYSGRRGAERLREEQRKIAEGNGGVFEKAEAVNALERVKQALKKFWNGVADFLHIHYKSAEEVADRVMKDLLEGVDPRKMGKTKDGGVRFSAKQKRALETASLGNVPRSLTVVSSAAGANVLNNIENLAKEFEKSATQPKTFIGDVAKALGASRFGSGSEYATFETKNGNIVTIRLANHNAHVSGFDHNDKDNGISIVISPKPNEGITNDGNAHITEFYYDSIKLRRAEGKPLAEIVRSIKQALYSGEFKDTTGLAERQEVNGEDVIRYQSSSENSDKTLAGVHNITEEKLRKALKLGGLANPSVAVIDISKNSHEGFGEISLILPSEKVAKRTGKNAGTWQGDAWTPTYPQIERRMSNKGAEKASKDVLSVPSDMYSEVRIGLDRWLDSGEANSAMAYMFLHEKGVAPEPKKIQPKFSDEAYNELKSITAGNFNIYGISKADAQKVLAMYIDAYFDGDKDLYEDKTKAWLEKNRSIVDAGDKGGMRYAIAKENVKLYDEYGFNYRGVQTFVRDVEYDHRNTGVDMNATLNEVEDYIKTNSLTDEFNTWQEGKEKEYGIKEVIFDGFTPSGNRRYIPNTLENVSKIMKKQGRNGATGAWASFPNFAARLMPSYGTLEDIRSKKGLLTSDREKIDDFREKWSKVFFELGMKCQPDATGTFDDYGFDRLSEAAMTSDPQAFLKQEYNVDFSDEDTKRLKKMVKAIKEEYPAMYFETKFERPVYLNEFAAVVVPNDLGADVKKALSDLGIAMYEYDASKEGDRSRAFDEAVKSSGKIRFQFIGEKGAAEADHAEEVFANENVDRSVRESRREKTELTAEERELRDNLVERMRKGGLDVVTDSEEMQRVIDTENERTRMMGAGSVREHRVYHGSGADFDAFDHSHMGEGEGAQAYGWGTYVTEVEGIGRTYAVQNTTTHNDALRALQHDVDAISDQLNRHRDDLKYDEEQLKRANEWRAEAELDYELFKDEAEKLKEKYGEASPEYRNHLFNDIYTDEMKRAQNSVKSTEESIQYRKEKIAELEKALKDKQAEIDELPKEFPRHLYTVEIPDDNGSNYLDWDGHPAESLLKDVGSFLESNGFERVQDSPVRYEKGESTVVLNPNATGADLYAELQEALGGDKKASQALAELGYTGIKYPADNMRGGRKDGAKNYVIFNENDAKITDHTRFLRTAGGEVYGLVKDGRIYLDPKVATSETAVHEYTHLWGDMLRRKDAEQWSRTVKELKNSVLWEEVKELYPELKTDDEIADEVLSTFSGRRGAERLREEARRVADGEGGVFTKAKAIETLERVKEAIARFWEGVARMFGINRYRSAEELADMAMRDLLDSKNPMKDESGMRKRGEVGETLATSGTYFSGGGLLEAGLKGVIDPKVAVEFSEKIAGVYADNHGNHIVVADVRDVDPKKLVGAVGGGEVQYFHASPVCKNFSKAKREGGEVELDKETALSTAEFIAKTRPKVVTIENVKGYRNSEALKIITDELTRQGYDWDADVYNTADYGGYTKRERLIVRAKRDGKLPPKPEKLPEELRKKGWYSAVEDLIPHLEEKKTGVPQGTDERLKNSGIDYRTIDKPLYVFGRGYANKTVGHAFADELLPTLTTGGGDIIIMPDGRVLKASPRVLARVTGLPDTYKMPETDQLSHTIVGNGIPTQLTEGVIAPLLDNAIPSAERATKRESVFDVADRVSQNLEERTRAMGSRVEKRMADVAQKLEGRELTAEQKAVVDVFSGKSDNQKFFVEREDGKKQTYLLKQGNEEKAGAKHSLYRHYGTNTGVITADDVLKIPQVLERGERIEKAKGGKKMAVYTMDVDGAKFTVYTRIGKDYETIDDFYSNKKGSERYVLRNTDGVNNTPEGAHNPDSEPSAKVEDKSEPPKLFGEEIIDDGKKGSDSTDRSVRENPKNEDKPRLSRKPGESIFDYASRVSEDVDRSVRERVSARDEYEKKVKSKGFQTKEALQNSMLGLQEFMFAIDHASGNKRYIEDIPDFENPILGENRLSSVNKEEMHQVAKTQFKPLMSAVAKLSGNGKESGELYDYMFAKHGLERDAVMRQREAQKEFDKYQKANPKGTKTIGDFVASLEGKDYAGLTALTAEDGRVKSIQSQIDAIDEQMKATDDQLLLRNLGGQKKRLKVDLLNAARDAADDIRKAFESNPSHDRSDINELWKRVNEVNGNTLRKLYESGLLTKEAYDDISSMYTNYIPMRGFDQTTSADAYAYLTHGDSAFNAPIKTAKGRSSKADNPIAYMQAMAESAIMQGNRNVLVKQKMLNFVRNHPSDLASVSDVWLQYDSVADEWKPVFPDNIGANDSASVVAKKMEAFEDKMKQMAEKHPNLVKRSNEAPDIPYKVVEKGQLNEHQVLVKQNGKSYIITVNGSPRAAQAANGLTNPDTDLTGAVGKVLEGAEALNRQLSSFYTTLNPDFIGSNYVRDALYSNTMVYVKEGAKYGGSFNLNFAKYNPAEMANLYARYNKGNLDTSNETHRLFLEFMQNGGETGFVNLKQIEKRKSEIAKAIKREGKISAAQIWGGASDAIDFANRAVENSARFAAYVTSRRSGRSVGRSVYDAKEISVNFNRKGSGSKFMGAEGQTKAGNAAAFVSGAGRGLYIFWNAGIQGLTNFSRQIGRHPGRALTLASLLFGFGALMSYLGSNDDDDENNYFNLPKYIRRSNVCYKIGDLFVTIPLPVEYRAFYGLGELASSTLAGKESGTTKDIAKEAVSQISQLFPIDFMEGGGGLHALIPSAVKPIVEAETNTAWTGLPIYKDNDFNKNMPEYTKVYKTANGYLVEIARALNDATGGNKYKKGFIDINPAKMEYVLKGMLGGAFSFPDKLVKTTETIMGDREFDWRNTPFANRFVKNADERTEYKALNEQYFKLKDEMDVVKQQLKGFEKEADAGNEKYEKALRQLEDSKDYERLELFKDYEKEFKGLNDELKELRMSPDYDKAEEKELQKEIAELQRQLIDEMREIKK